MVYVYPRCDSVVKAYTHRRRRIFLYKLTLCIAVAVSKAHRKFLVSIAEQPCKLYMEKRRTASIVKRRRFKSEPLSRIHWRHAVIKRRILRFRSNPVILFPKIIYPFYDVARLALYIVRRSHVLRHLESHINVSIVVFARYRAAHKIRLSVHIRFIKRSNSFLYLLLYGFAVKAFYFFAVHRINCIRLETRLKAWNIVVHKLLYLKPYKLLVFVRYKVALSFQVRKYKTPLFAFVYIIRMVRRQEVARVKIRVSQNLTVYAPVERRSVYKIRKSFLIVHNGSVGVVKTFCDKLDKITRMQRRSVQHSKVVLFSRKINVYSFFVKRYLVRPLVNYRLHGH